MTNASFSSKQRSFRHLDAGPGPAVPLDESDILLLASRAVSLALDEPRLAKRPAARWQSLALAAVVAVSSAGAATITVRQLASRAPDTSPTTTASEKPAAPTPTRAPQRQRPVHEAAVPDPASAAVAEAAQPPRVVAKPAAKAIASEAVEPVPAQAAPITFEDQLAQANLLRRDGRWRDAESAYMEIARRLGASPDAEVASLSAAALRLEHLADHQGALRLYQSLLRSPTLAAEAHYGVARCQRSLGDTAAEEAALVALLERAPESLQAERSRQRLAQLRARNASVNDPKD